MPLKFRCEWTPYKLHAGVVDEEVLNVDPPVGPESEVPAALRGLAHVAPPGVDVLHPVKVSRADQHIQAVLTETPGRQRTKPEEERGVCCADEDRASCDRVPLQSFYPRAQRTWRCVYLQQLTLSHRMTSVPPQHTVQ